MTKESFFFFNVADEEILSARKRKNDNDFVFFSADALIATNKNVCASSPRVNGLSFVRALILIRFYRAPVC